jgi:hypothetical protein
MSKIKYIDYKYDAKAIIADADIVLRSQSPTDGY